MSKISKAIEKYLQNYAEPEAHSLENLAQLPERKYALVIPAYKEGIGFVERLTQHPQAHNICLILVVNEPENREISQENTNLLQALSLSRYGDQNIRMVQRDDLVIVLISRCHPNNAIPDKQGVGLARKVGCDVACALIQSAKIKQPWIYSSDADAHLPGNYFVAEPPANVSAATYEFQHIAPSDDTILHATLIYERCLRYYRQQLQAAGSPYAHHALGSCLAVSMSHYCQARGFPKRSAGEDFYLLNKLAKLGPIERRGSIIELDARDSGRVPFGTGPAARSIAEKLANNEPITYYDPRIFKELEHVLAATPALWAKRHSSSLLLIDCLSGLPELSQRALEEAGIENFLHSRFTQDKHQDAFTEHFHAWFDAFRTLKFIHFLQAHNYPPVVITDIFNTTL